MNVLSSFEGLYLAWKGISLLFIPRRMIVLIGNVERILGVRFKLLYLMMLRKKGELFAAVSGIDRHLGMQPSD